MDSERDDEKETKKRESKEKDTEETNKVGRREKGEMNGETER